MEQQPRRDYLIQEHRHLVSLCNTVLGAANTVAGKALFDAVEAIKADRKLFRQGVKKNLNLATEKFREYEKIHFQNMGDRYQMFLDYLDSVEELLKPNIDMLEMQFRQLFLKNDVTEPYMKAKVATADMMLELAVKIFEGLMKEAKKKTQYDFTPWFSRGKIDSPLFYFRKAADSLLGEANRINPSTDANLVRAIRILEKTLTDANLFNKAGYMALQYNSNLVGSCISEEDYEMLAREYRGETLPDPPLKGGRLKVES
jgi:hypothetical protein